MKIGILSDIHSMDMILDNILQKMVDCDLIFNLGDTVGYHGDVNRCIDLLSQKNIINLYGDHDLEVFGKKKQKNQDTDRPSDYGLTDENIQKIKKFRLKTSFSVGNDKYVFIHGQIIKRPGFLTFDRAEDYNAVDLINELNCKYLFVGHSHIPRFMEIDENNVLDITELFETRKFSLKPDSSYIIDVGSAANNCYVLADIDNKHITFICNGL